MAHVNVEKTKKTAEKMEGNDFIGFLKDEVTKHKKIVSTKVAILKKKQDGIAESVLAVPSTSGNNVDPRILGDHNSSKNVVPKVQALPDGDSNYFTFPGGDSNYLMADNRWYIYDEYDGPDQFVDFIEKIEMGDDEIREYFDMYEDIIFNTDPSSFEELCNSKKY